MKDEPPRFVVHCKVEDGKEMFGWGTVGNIPLLSLIANIVQIQQKLSTSLPYQIGNIEGRHCPEKQLVSIYCPNTRKFDWFVGDVSFESMVGFLEIVKLEAVTVFNRMMSQRQSQQQPHIIGVDGNPLRKMMN